MDDFFVLLQDKIMFHCQDIYTFVFLMNMQTPKSVTSS